MNRKYLFFSIIAAFFILIAGTVFTLIFGSRHVLNENFLFPPLLLLTILVPVSLEIGLHRSLQKTVYSYRNIVYIAAMFFSASFFLAFLNGYIICLQGHQALTAAYLTDILMGFPEQFAVFALPVILLISFLIFISNLSLIRHEGFRPKNLLGMILGGGYIGITVLLELLLRFLENRVLIPAGFFGTPLFRLFYTFLPSFLLIMLCYFDCIFLSCFVLGYLAVKKEPAHDKDIIIILGCAIDNKGGLRPLLKGRVNRAMKFAWEQEIENGRPVKYLPSGGQGKDEIMSEGSAMELYLLSHGAEEYEVLPEKKSANTRENFLYSKKIIDEQMPGAKVAFATTNYHVLRSGILARKAGLEAEGVSSKTKWYFWPNGFLREVIAIIVMYKKTHISVGMLTFVICMLLSLLTDLTRFL